jgi:iron(III) transport system permease protein
VNPRAPGARLAAAGQAALRFVASGGGVLTLLVLAFLGVFLLWPLGHVFRRAAVDAQGFTLLYLRTLFTDPVQLQATALSFTIAFYVTLGCFVVALPLAWLFARRSFFGKPLWAGLLLLPMILPPFVSAVGMKMLFARCGALSTLLMNLGLADGPVDWFGRFPLLGIVLLEVLHLFPVLYLNLMAALANIDPSLEEAAANLGSSPWRAFRRVTLPLAAPGIFAGLVLVFVWAFTELGTPLVFGVRRVLPVMIYDSIAEIGTNPRGYAQVTLVLVVAALGFLVSKRLTARGRTVATLGRLSTQRLEKPLGGWGTAAAWLGLAAIVGIAVLPHLSVVLLGVSRRWFMTVLPQGFTLEFFDRALNSELTRTALVNSLTLSLGATVLDLLVGFAIAWLCVRRRIYGSDLLDAMAMLPLAIPGLVVAFGYLGTFSGAFGRTFLAPFLDPRTNPMLLLAVSYSIRRLPYMVRSAHAGLEQVSRTYEEAAANLGASPLRVVWRVTLPLIVANLLAGGILCFSFSMMEVSDSLILAQSEPFYPITKAIYTLVDGLENGLNVAAALGTWAMALLGAGLLWATALLGKRIGQMFRSG